MAKLKDLFLFLKERVIDKPRAQKTFEEKLIEAKDGSSIKIDNLLPLLDDYNKEGVSAVLNKRVKDKPEYKKTAEERRIEDAQFIARHLEKMKIAQTALALGNIDPVVELAQDGKHNSFIALTKDDSDVSVLNAKAKVAEILFKDDAQESSGNWYFFGRSCANEAIYGYSKLGIIAECEATMRGAMTKYYEHHEDYLLNGREEFAKGNADTIALGVATTNILKEQKDSMTFEDHVSIVKYHPDDAEKSAALKAINLLKHTPDLDKNALVSSTYSRLTYQQYDEHFELLANHIKTTDGSSKPSQSIAMQALMSDYRDVFFSNGFDLLDPKGEELLEIFQEELLIGTPHVVEEGFVKGNVLTAIQRNSDVVRTNDEGTSFRVKINMTDLLPSDLQGTKINQVRNAIAESELTKFANGMTGHNQSSGDHARIAAVLSRDVLSDPSMDMDSAETKMAESNLRELIIMESSQSKLNVQKYNENAEEINTSNWYQPEKEKYHAGLLKQQTPLGYGLAALDSLKYGSSNGKDGGIEMIKAAERIEKALPENHAIAKPEAKILTMKMVG